MSFKSISSFLATILLIGFTISTGIIVYYFASTLPRTQTQQISSQASKVLSCAGAAFDAKVRNCNLLNGLVLWLPMDEGSGNTTYDYFRNEMNTTYYSSGLQENSTLLQLNSATNGEHDFYINEVPNEILTKVYEAYGGVDTSNILLNYSSSAPINLTIYVNGYYAGSYTLSAGSYQFARKISNLRPNQWNNITYVVNDTINITYSSISYNFASLSSPNALSCKNNNCQIMWTNGKTGKGLNFDGIRNFVSSYLYIPQTYEMTFSLWIKDIDPTQSKGICDFNRDIGFNSFWGYYKFDVRGVVYPAPYEGVASSQPSSQYGSDWIHLVGTWKVDPSINKICVRIFVNGRKDTESCWNYNTLGFIGKTNVYLFTGAWWWAQSELNPPSAFFNGTIDEVRIYNRALSEDEVKELYYEGLTNKFNITIGLLNSGYADLGNSFTAIVYLKNGTILQLPLILDNNLSKGYYLEKTLTIDGYYPSYGLVDKIMV